MAKANIHRRSTLEGIYPLDVFASDAAQNGSVSNTVLSGVRILSAPDAAGDFDFERAVEFKSESKHGIIILDIRFRSQDEAQLFERDFASI